MEKYDSKADTLLHIKRAAQFLTESASELNIRTNKQDNSKIKRTKVRTIIIYV
jgi:hypothetical protein